MDSGQPSGRELSFDLDKDGVPDVLVNDTNGHTVYVNVRWLVGLGILAVSTIAGLVAYL